MQILQLTNVPAIGESHDELQVAFAEEPRMLATPMRRGRKQLAFRRQLERRAEVDHNRTAGRLDAQSVDVRMGDVGNAARFRKAQTGSSCEINGFHTAVLREMLRDSDRHACNAAAMR